MKQLEVQIMGQGYLLGCPEGGQQRLLDAVDKVDTTMCRIRDAGKVKARDRIAVLAAVNLAFEVADRPAAAAYQAAAFAGHEPTLGSAAAAAASPAAAAPAGPDERPSPTLSDELRIASLIARIDRALGDDGRLL